MAPSKRIPITIITGFTGSGKTTLLLNLIPQLKADPNYKLALIKNEIGDVAVDTQLASSSNLSASKELLGDCICCTNVGQIQEALETLAAQNDPDRIIIETSGSAEPLKLVLEVRRLNEESGGKWELDGVVSVIDAENWTGYASTSFTAKLQAKQTDLIVINKWESLSERAFDLFLDKLGDLDVDTPQVKSDRGWISKDLLFGFDSTMARAWARGDGDHDHDHGHGHEHKSEIECLSVKLVMDGAEGSVNLKKLEQLLRSAPKDEVYRIKAVLYSTSVPLSSDGEVVKDATAGCRNRYLLNWSFGRWTWALGSADDESSAAPALRMSIFTAPYESNKWTKKVEGGGLIELESGQGILEVKRVQ